MASLGAGAAAAANRAFFMKMKDKSGAPGGATAAGEAAGLSDQDAEKKREEQRLKDEEKKKEEEKRREEERLKLKEELRLLREKEEKEKEVAKARDEAAKAAAEAEARAKKASEPVVSAKETRDIPASASAPAPTPAPAPISAPSAPAASSSSEPTRTADTKSGPLPFRLRAIIDYEAKKDDELSYKKGDILFGLPNIDLTAATCTATFSGRSGILILNNVEDSATGKRCGPPVNRTGVRCRAVGNYTARADDELSFKQGDIVFVTVCTPTPTWTGVCKGKVGKFPRKLVAEVNPDGSLAEPVPEVKADGKVKAAVTTVKYVCVKPFTAESADQLSIDFFDVIIVAKDSDDDFLQGVCKGNHGLFPANNVVRASEYTKQQIEQMISVEKLQMKASGSAWSSFDAPAPANDPFMPLPPANDPFMPLPAASDPFMPTSDPWGAPAPAAAAFPTSDPFAASSSVYSSPVHAPSSASHTPLLPPVSAAFVQAALASSHGAALITPPPSASSARARTGSHGKRPQQSAPAGGSHLGAEQPHPAFVTLHGLDGGDGTVSRPLGPAW